MTEKSYRWVWKEDLPWREKFVLLTMAWYADGDLCCSRSVSQLSADTEISPRGVRGAIRRLVSSGMISEINNYGGEPHYRIISTEQAKS